MKIPSVLSFVGIFLFPYMVAALHRRSVPGTCRQPLRATTCNYLKRKGLCTSSAGVTFTRMTHLCPVACNRCPPTRDSTEITGVGNATYIRASFEDEMAALERDMERDETASVNIKKSIKDLTTEELIAELEKDLQSTKRDTVEGKFRNRFENIIERKGLMDDIQYSHGKSGNMYNDVVSALYDSMDEKREEAVPGACVDLRTDCNFLKTFCYTHNEKLRVSCAKTCKFCVECKQRINVKTCTVLKGRGLCNAPNPATRNRMIKLCPITCGFCKVPAPPKCSATKDGCCWDKTTTKMNHVGTNCPECKNMYRYVCKTFKPDCISFLRPGEFMRANCPDACGLCQGKCHDDRNKHHLCPFWKKDLNFCKEKESIMRFYCPQTCEFC